VRARAPDAAIGPGRLRPLSPRPFAAGGSVFAVLALFPGVAARAASVALSVALSVAFSGALVLLAPALEATAWAGGCEVSGYATAAQDRDGAIAEAGSLSSTGHWADSRAVYLWVLARYPDDAEALFGLARLDSWGGCYHLAEEEYRFILAKHPDDADVRGGYADLLLWDGRTDEAVRLVARGLVISPGSPALLQRAARMAYWSGDATSAVRLADAAEQGAPDDGDVRAERDALFLREARATLRFDRYPASYQDLTTASILGLWRIGRFDLTGGAELVGRTGAGLPTLIDVHYPIGLAWHPAMGVTLGGEVEPGAPAQAIADLALRFWATAPITHRIDFGLTYQFWRFSSGPEAVHIFNPALGVLLPHEVRFELRAWIAAADLSGHGTLPSQSSVVGAVGGLVTWHAAPRFDTGLSYTYGAELDQNPALVQLIAFKSHVISAYGDRILGRHGGVRLTLGIDRREAPGGDAIGVPSAEVSGYLRW
jgi:tetratricopeptide (TPR) repeat protein